MNIKKIIFSFILSLSLALGLANSALAATYQASDCVPGANNTNDPYGLGCAAGTTLSQNDPRIMIAKIINTALGVLGILFTVLIVYAGFKWMTAAGNEDAIKSAKSILISSIIGLAIIFSAFAISKFVLESLDTATKTN
jgi:hypothetical protein